MDLLYCSGHKEGSPSFSLDDLKSFNDLILPNLEIFENQFNDE
ncbi:hypothetical protein [Snuella lapsa]|uniref:Uncharacterized protein n=1 Tax=Snuella lapsa TaxID=870481 RepID=A0ABP6X3P5_9FLAO